jgi:phage tail protein X
MPIYNSKVTSYNTSQGDIWDIIAYRVYGDEHAMHFLQDANYDYRFQDAFPANVTLVIPESVEVKIDLTPSASIIDVQGLLPWR